MSVDAFGNRAVIHLIDGCEGYGVATVLRQISKRFSQAGFISMSRGPMTDQLPPDRIIWIGEKRPSILVGESTLLALLSLLKNAASWWGIAGDIAHALPKQNILLHCHSQYTVLVATLVRYRCSTSDMKVLFHFHGTMNLSRWFGIFPAVQRMMMGLVADGIIAVSKAVADYWKPCGCPIWVVHNGIEPHKVDESAINVEINPAIRNILIAGSLSQDKGHLVAVRAMAMLGDKAARFHLWIAGGSDDAAVNPFARELRQEIADLKLADRITMLGFVPNIRRILPHIWVALQQRISAEPCSMWVLETMQAGIPLIASETGGTPELVRHGQEGLLVPPDSPTAVAEAILRLDEDPTLRGCLSTRAIERSSCFTETKFIDKINAIYGCFGVDFLSDGKDARPRTILTLVYNTVPTLLSGHSLIGLLHHVDRTRYHVVTLFNRPCKAEESLSKSGIATMIVPFGGGSWLKRLWQYGRLPMVLWNIARKVNPAVVYADNALAGRAAIFLKILTGLPTIVHLRNIGFPRRSAALLLQADCFAAVSRATIEGTLPPKFASKAIPVYDGLELSEYPMPTIDHKREARRHLGFPPNAVVVAMAGRLTQQKGQWVLLQAAKLVLKNHPEVLFIHAGGIPTQNSRHRYERELELDSQELCADGHWRWIDYLDRMGQFWAAADIAVAPSAGPEALGRVILESMATGLPVITTRTGGPQEIIEASHAGVCIAPADAQALANSIAYLVRDPMERQRLGNAAREYVKLYHSAEAYASRMAQLFDAYCRPQPRG